MMRLYRQSVGLEATVLGHFKVSSKDLELGSGMCQPSHGPRLPDFGRGPPTTSYGCPSVKPACRGVPRCVVDDDDDQ